MKSTPLIALLVALVASCNSPEPETDWKKQYKNGIDALLRGERVPVQVLPTGMTPYSLARDLGYPTDALDKLQKVEWSLPKD